MELAELTNVGGEINRLENTTYPYLEPSTPSYSYDKFNENTDITSKKALTSQTNPRTIFSLEDKFSDNI